MQTANSGLEDFLKSAAEQGYAPDDFRVLFGSPTLELGKGPYRPVVEQATVIYRPTKVTRIYERR